MQENSVYSGLAVTYTVDRASVRYVLAIVFFAAIKIHRSSLKAFFSIPGGFTIMEGILNSKSTWMTKSLRDFS